LTKPADLLTLCLNIVANIVNVNFRVEHNRGLHAEVIDRAATRIVSVPEGQFASYEALTFAELLGGHLAATIWVLLGAAAWMAILDLRGLVRRRASRWAAALRPAPANLWLPWQIISGLRAWWPLVSCR
jgi:hypothetical protein